MKVEAVVLGSPSLIVVMVSVDVKQHSTNERNGVTGCVSMQGARLWLCKFSGVVVNHAFSPDYFHGCIAYKTEKNRSTHCKVQELCDSRGGRPGLPVLMNLMVSVDVKQH